MRRREVQGSFYVWYCLYVKREPFTRKHVRCVDKQLLNKKGSFFFYPSMKYIQQEGNIVKIIRLCNNTKSDVVSLTSDDANDLILCAGEEHV